MSIRYKLKRRQRYYWLAWLCPICTHVNHRDHEGLDQCDACAVHTYTRYQDDSGRLACIEASDENLEVRCWCGSCGTYEQLFDDRFLDDTCGGMGVLYCHCGGDLCVCHHHGETECFGCADCEEPEDETDLYGYDYLSND